ncbi:dolichyl-diphosphooligosaccharide--protein glycosyltransferase subunit 2-like [Babylonia areolata]|uniref:dolichyl-diphosphooligosaccharide--protein glycosyltransferase subunit 2-like n=1 Tax=Babylonia areolata TaxID=304850 RepID=UPI003FD19C04
MAKVCSVLILLAVAVVGKALTPSTFLTTVDQQRLRSVFESAAPYVDLPSAHYSILGIKLLGGTMPSTQDTCKFLQSKVDAGSIESVYHASGAAAALGGCKFDVPSAKQLLTDAIAAKASVQDISFAFFAMKNLGIAVDEKSISAALLEALKSDDSPLSHGYAFMVASALKVDTSKFFDNIEDVIAQADEVDDKYVQFEGGLFVTGLVVDGAYKLAEKEKKAPTIAEDKVAKLANYFLSRKHVHQLKAASQFVSVIKTLTDNKFHIPIAVSLGSSVAVSQSEPVVKVRVTNLLGGDLGQLTVTADSARHLGDEAIVLSKKQFTPSSADKSQYELNFMEAKPARGFYRLTVSVAPKKADSRLIGITGAEVEVKVTTKVSVENVEIGVADKDQTVAARTTKLVHPNKAQNTLEADYHQKILMRFQLKDRLTGQLMAAHQTFVRLTNLKSKQEIIFVSEADGTLTNKFDLDVGASAKEFGYQSGKYSVELIVGDAIIENPFSWTLADAELTFPEGGAPKGDGQNQYSKKPEIKHMFREPEKRPPAPVSMTFTALVMLPLLILLLLWLKIGVNVSNFPFSVSAIGFHVCLAGIFGLYYLYWTQLNMFQTLRYLGILAVPTFLFGNRLLSGIASKRKSA